MSRRLLLLAGLLLIILLNSCNMALLKTDSLEIVIKGSNFTIEWDDDSLNIANNSNKAVKFKIYYRTHGTIYWEYLDEIDAHINPTYTFHNYALDFGRYDIGVSSLNQNGNESQIHSSLDMSAEPFCGWYINWIGSK